MNLTHAASGKFPSPQRESELQTGSRFDGRTTAAAATAFGRIWSRGGGAEKKGKGELGTRLSIGARRPNATNQ